MDKKHREMRHTRSHLILVFICSLFFAACGGGNSSIEQDAKRIADLQCRSIKLMQKASSGDMGLMQESAELSTQASALMRQVESKYAAAADKKLLADAVQDAMKDCQ